MSTDPAIPLPRRILHFLGLQRSTIAMVGFVIVIVFPSWQAVIVGSVFFISWSSISLPATMGLIARVLPAAKRTMGVSMHSLVNCRARA